MDKEKIKAFADRVYTDMAGAMTAGLGYVGVKTGLFGAMSGKGPLRLPQVVEASGLHSRYVQEWLSGLASAGYLHYDPAAETFELPDEHAYLLASEGTDHYVGGMYVMATVLLGLAPEIATAFRQGGGVPFDAIGAEGMAAIDAMTRGGYERRLADFWLAAMPDVVARLRSGGSALDVGCGAGVVSLSLARSYPQASLTGVDLSAESIAKANQQAEAAGLRERVRFIAAAVDSLPKQPGYDFITLCDVLHDLADPLTTLAEIRSLLKPGGTLLVIEPHVADHLEDNQNPLATMYYGFSLFHCMTQSLARNGVGLGACLGPRKTEQILREAGFGRFEKLDIKSQVNLFYAVGH